MAAKKGADNTTVTFNANAITNYVNSVDLQTTIAELEATHLGSTATESDAGLASYSLQIGGDWNATIDGYLAPDAMASTKRTAVITFSDGSSTVTYTWTSEAFITNWNIALEASNKITWAATLRLSGNGSRSVS